MLLFFLISSVSAYGAEIILRIIVPASGNVPAHILVARYFRSAEFFACGYTFTVPEHSNAHKGKQKAEYEKNHKRYPKHTNRNLLKHAFICKRPEIYRSSKSHKSQSKVKIKVREKLRRQLAAVRTDLHTIGNPVTAVFAYFHIFVLFNSKPQPKLWFLFITSPRLPVLLQGYRRDYMPQLSSE